MGVEGTKKFADEIKRIIDYFSQEFDLTYAEAVGVMHMIIMDIHAESWESEEDEYIEE